MVAGAIHVDILISIHALREEGDNGLSPAPASVLIFLSTPSARRATPSLQPSTRSSDISIHALREEGDAIVGLYNSTKSKFLSTPSARRAT